MFENPLEFLDEIERFCSIKNIKNNQKLNILNAMLHGKARVWYDLQGHFDTYDAFCTAFKNEFFTIPTQVKIKSNWALKKFTDQKDNLQTFFYRQAKEANFFRPKMTEFEKNFTIVQQLPHGVRKALAAVNYSDSQAILQTLANLDALHSEKTRYFERKQFNYNNTERKYNDDRVRVQQVRVQYQPRKYWQNRDAQVHSVNNRDSQANSQRYSTRRNLVYNKSNVNTQSRERDSSAPSLPDTRYPPPNLSNTNNRSSTLNFEQTR